jgi:hypothetical protein
MLAEQGGGSPDQRLADRVGELLPSEALLQSGDHDLFGNLSSFHHFQHPWSSLLAQLFSGSHSSIRSASSGPQSS